MKNSTVTMSAEACREMALTLIDNLPRDEFIKITDDIKMRARRRAFSALEQMRLAAKRSGLKRRDFEQALKEVRAEKRKKRNRCHS